MRSWPFPTSTAPAVLVLSPGRSSARFPRPGVTLRRVPISLHQELLADVEGRRLAWLKRRFLVFCVLAALICSTGFIAAAVGTGSQTAPRIMLRLSGMALWAVAAQVLLLLVVAGFVLLGRGPRQVRGYLRLATLLVAGVTLLQVPLAVASADLLERVGAVAGAEINIGFGLAVLLFTLVVHLVACLVIPWKPIESLVPIAPLLFVFMAAVSIEFLGGGSDGWMVLLVLLLILLVVGPGVLVCWVRSAWFTDRFQGHAYRERYEEIAAELDLARRIHERLFPMPSRHGPLKIDYAYEPMRSIGGDFLFVRRIGGIGITPLHIVVIDVTGHGIAAALAVNRLHGELERAFGVMVDPSPGTLLAEINRYVELTMAGEGIYATAICLRIDPHARSVQWASAAHPPALVRGGREPRELAATTFVLGAVGDADFQPQEQAAPFFPGESVLVYTDGAFELNTGSSRLLGLPGFMRLADNFLGHRPSWAKALQRELLSLRRGPATDDTLIVEVDFTPEPTPGAWDGASREEQRG